MSDQNERLEPGAAGRLAVLVGEMRSMRTVAEQLGEGANALAEEVRRQGDRLDELTAIVSVLADGVSEIHQILTRPPVALPKLPRETAPASSGPKPSTQPDLLDPVAATVAAVVVTATDDPAPSSAEPSSPSSDISGDGGSSGGGGSDSSF